MKTTARTSTSTSQRRDSQRYALKDIKFKCNEGDVNDDSEFDDLKVVESKKKRKTTRNIAASTTVATTTTTMTTTAT